jgi:hypothetical protein
MRGRKLDPASDSKRIASFLEWLRWAGLKIDLTRRLELIKFEKPSNVANRAMHSSNIGLSNFRDAEY